MRTFRLCLLALSFLSFFVACNDEVENKNPEGSTYLWTPAINVERGDGEAKIFLTDPTTLSLYAHPGPAKPSYFTMMISNDLETFSAYQTVNETVLIKDLVNEKPYFFFVTAHRKHFPSVNSDTLMIIPSEALERNGYTPDPDNLFERFSVSFDQSFGLYRVNDKYYQFKSSEPDFVHLVDNQSYYARWSSNANLLVYVKDTLINSVSYPYSINIYDPEMKSSTVLLAIPYEDYLASNPLFTPDGSKITFLSTEGNAEENIYDLWSIDVTTKEKVKLSNFEGTGFVTYGKFAWDGSEQDIYLDGAYGMLNTDIYKFNVATKLLTPIIVSKWSDKDPTISPDGNIIAFVSIRSGDDELWTYNLTNSKYRQITGESDYEFDSRYSEVQWLDNESLLISVQDGTKHVVVTLDVNE
jgi:hypothetical protein